MSCVARKVVEDAGMRLKNSRLHIQAVVANMKINQTSRKSLKVCACECQLTSQ